MAAAAAFWSKGIYAIPVCFFVGYYFSDIGRSKKLEDAYVERRVQQRLGVWKPPELTPSDRARLIAEKETILAEIRDIERKTQRPA